MRTLHPGYFALAMATGIVSIAMRDQHALPLSVALLWFALFGYAVLVALNVWRLAGFRADVAADLADPRRAFGLFTFAAWLAVLTAMLGHLGQARTDGDTTCQPELQAPTALSPRP